MSLRVENQLRARTTYMLKLLEKILTCNSSEEEKIKGVLVVEMPCEKWFLKMIEERCEKSKVMKLRASFFFKL